MTSPALPEGNPPRASWGPSYGKSASTAGPPGEGAAPIPPYPGAPTPASEDDYPPRPFWVSDSGRLHFVESRAPPTAAAPAFAGEDGDLCGLPWFTHAAAAGNYPPAPRHPHALEDRGPAEPATEAPGFAAEDGHLLRGVPPWATKMGDYLASRCPHLGEDGVPGEPPMGAPILVAEDGNLRVPPWVIKMRKYPTTPCPHGEEDGAPQTDHHLAITNSSFPAGEYPQIPADVAPKQISAGNLISALKRRDVHRAISVTNDRIRSFKREILRGQAVILRTAKSKSSAEDSRPLGAAATNQKEPGTLSPQPGSHSLGLPASDVSPSVEAPTLGLPSARARPPLDHVKCDRAAATTSNATQNTFSGSLVEGKAIEKPTSWQCSAAKEMKAGKGKVASKDTKTVTFDLSPPKAAEPLDDRGRLIVEDPQLLQATSHTKKGRKEKTCPFMDNYAEFKAKFHSTKKKRKRRKITSTPIPLSEQILKGQGVQLLNIPLPRKLAGCHPVEDKVVENTTTKASPSADDEKEDGSSSKITKRVRIDLSLGSAEEPAIKHLVARDKLVAKVLKWYKAATTTGNVHKISNLPKTKGRTTRRQAAKATLAVEDLNQDGATLLRKSMQKTKSFQLAEATAVTIQAAGMNSAAEGTELDETTSSTKITNQTASPPKVADQPTGPLTVRANSYQEIKSRRLSLVTSNIYLTISPPRAKDPAMGLLAARGKTKEDKQLNNDVTTKLVYQTLRIGSVKLLPVRVIPEDFNTAGRTGTVCDLEITGTSHTCIHPRMEKPQEFTKFRCSKGECSKPHTNRCALTVALGEQQLYPGEHANAKDIHRCPRRHLQSSNISHKKKCSKPKKLLKLKDNLKEKTVGAHKMIGIWENKIQIHEEQLQQEDIIFVKGHNTSLPEYSVTNNEPY